MTRPFETILLATDLTVRSDRAAARAASLAAAPGGGLHVVHVLQDGLPAAVVRPAKDAAAAEIAAVLDKAGAKAKVEVVVGDPEARIREAAEDAHADLIVMGPHRNEGGRRGLRGTGLERVARQSARPVLLAAGPGDRPYRKVLAAIDFSTPSRKALRAAMRLAPAAEIVLVHAYQTPFEGFALGDDTREAVRQEEETAIDALIAEEVEALKAGAGLTDTDRARIKVEIRHGPVRAVLDTAIAEHKPDVIALGAHGRSALSYALLGGVAEHVLRAPRADILVVSPATRV